VSVLKIVAMLLRRLGSDNGPQSIGDLYRVHKSTLSKIMRKLIKLQESICNQLLCKLQMNCTLEL
jgi:hypothetical protein